LKSLCLLKSLCQVIDLASKANVLLLASNVQGYLLLAYDTKGEYKLAFAALVIGAMYGAKRAFTGHLWRKPVVYTKKTKLHD